MVRALTAPATLATFALAGLALLLPARVAALGPANPFAPPAPQAAKNVPATPPGSGLTGLRLGATPAALINGEWVRVGQTALGAKLISVSRREARLLHPDGRSETLSLADGTAASLSITRVDADPFSNDANVTSPPRRVGLKSTP